MTQKKMSRRDFLNLAAVTTAGSVLAACQPGAAPSSNSAGDTGDAPSGEAVTLNFWGFTGPIWDAIWDSYEEQTGVAISLSETGDIVFGDQKYLTAAAAGTGPDNAVQNRHTFLQFSAKGLYADVTARFDADGLSRDDWTSVQLEETSWEGKLYGLPWFTDVRYLYWNKEHYAEAGLDPDSPPETWAELEEYTDKLTVRNDDGEAERFGFVPYLFGNSWMWLYGFLNKAPAISDDKRTILCDHPKWIETLDWMVNFYDNYVGDFELANAFSEATQSAGLGLPFVAGKTSMSATGNWHVADLLRSPGVDYDVAPMPIPPGGEKSTWSCGFSIVLAPEAQHPDEAWELMKWATGIDGWDARAIAEVAETKRTWEREQLEGDAQFWPTLACNIPALRHLEEKYVSDLGDLEKKAWALSVDALENWTHGCGSSMGVAALEYWVEMDNAARNALSHAMTAEEAMLEAKAKVQEATDRAWEAIDG